MSIELIKHLQSVLEDIHQQGLFKPERPLESPQGPSVHAQNWDEDLINLCANNYLGLANHPVMLAAAHEGLDSHGFGMASVRFICGTQDIHKALERKVADFVGMDDAILFSSCFDANGGIFEVLLDANDAVISDSLNHASIIDGIRLCKAQRLRYANNDMVDLEAQLIAAAGARFRLVVTDAVLSRICRRFATWPRRTTRWSWSTTATPSGLSASAVPARLKCTVSRGGCISPAALSARHSVAPAVAI
jgi:glycine C-acetyltransferase